MNPGPSVTFSSVPSTYTVLRGNTSFTLVFFSVSTSGTLGITLNDGRGMSTAFFGCTSGAVGEAAAAGCVCGRGSFFAAWRSGSRWGMATAFSGYTSGATGGRDAACVCGRAFFAARRSGSRWGVATAFSGYTGGAVGVPDAACESGRLFCFPAWRRREASDATGFVTLGAGAWAGADGGSGGVLSVAYVRRLAGASLATWAWRHLEEEASLLSGMLVLMERT